jgi:hypothetical protein
MILSHCRNYITSHPNERLSELQAEMQQTQTEIIRQKANREDPSALQSQRNRLQAEYNRELDVRMWALAGSEILEYRASKGGGAKKPSAEIIARIDAAERLAADALEKAEKAQSAAEYAGIEFDELRSRVEKIEELLEKLSSRFDES